MNGEIHVEAQDPERTDDRVRVSARIRGHPRPARRDGVLYFDVPEHTSEWLAIRGRGDDLHDAWLRAVIWSAMEAGGTLAIHGRVSASLLASVDRYQEIVCRWWPAYRPVRVRADEEVGDEAAAAAVAGDPRRRRAAILAYSGGLDSSETLVAHRKGWRGRNNLEIEACVFVHGFDIPLHDPAFAGACERARAIAGHYGADLVVARSNLKYLLPLWETTFSAGMTATLSLFERRFDRALMTGSNAYENLHWIASENGSTPWSDHLFSSGTFRVVSDLAVTRVEKTERLAAEPVVWRNLRVCWEGRDLATNCGRCEKCVRQMLCMRACGIDDFSAFQAPLTPDAVRAMRLPMPVVLEEWQRCYGHAAERGLAGDEVFVAMKDVLDRASTNVGRTRLDRLRRVGKLWQRRVRRLFTARSRGESAPSSVPPEDPDRDR